MKFYCTAEVSTSRQRVVYINVARHLVGANKKTAPSARNGRTRGQLVACPCGGWWRDRRDVRPRSSTGYGVPVIRRSRRCRHLEGHILRCGRIREPHFPPDKESTRSFHKIKPGNIFQHTKLQVRYEIMLFLSNSTVGSDYPGRENIHKPNTDSYRGALQNSHQNEVRFKK